MVIKIEVTKEGELVGRLENGDLEQHLGQMPKHRRNTPVQPRWRDGSFLTKPQKDDEEYCKKMGIAS